MASSSLVLLYSVIEFLAIGLLRISVAERSVQVMPREVVITLIVLSYHMLLANKNSIRMMTVEPAGYDGNSTGDDDGGDKATTHTPTGLYRKLMM